MEGLESGLFIPSLNSHLTIILFGTLLWFHEGRSEEKGFEKVLSREDVRSSYLGRKVSVIRTKLQFTILNSTEMW